jgi:hypothetical protein
MYQPHGALVGFDCQDLRTELSRVGGCYCYLSRADFAISNYHCLCWIASRHMSPKEFAETAAANLLLRDAATVLLCFEGGPKFTMSNLRGLVLPVVAKTPGNSFIKYFDDADLVMPKD